MLYYFKITIYKIKKKVYNKYINGSKVQGFFNPSGNYIRRRVFYNNKTFKFNVIKRIKFYEYNEADPS